MGESSSIKDFLVDFLVDFLMCLCISFIVLKKLKSSSSGLILISSQPSSFSIAFCLFISWSTFLPSLPFSSYCKLIVMTIKINSIA